MKGVSLSEFIFCELWWLKASSNRKGIQTSGQIQHIPTLEITLHIGVHKFISATTRRSTTSAGKEHTNLKLEEEFLIADRRSYQLEVDAKRKLPVAWQGEIPQSGRSWKHGPTRNLTRGLQGEAWQRKGSKKSPKFPYVLMFLKTKTKKEARIPIKWTRRGTEKVHIPLEQGRQQTQRSLPLLVQKLFLCLEALISKQVLHAIL